MNNEVSMIVAKIAEIAGDDNFAYLAESKLDELSTLDRQGESIDALLRIFEENPDADFGMPGPLVRFLEQFYRKGYEPKLIESLRRKPVPHTLWMLNRIINGSSGEERRRYVAELRLISQRHDVSAETKKAAEDFLILH
jgi:hypothetical protein